MHSKRGRMSIRTRDALDAGGARAGLRRGVVPAPFALRRGGGCARHNTSKDAEGSHVANSKGLEMSAPSDFGPPLYESET